MTRLSGRDFATRPYQAGSRDGADFGHTRLERDPRRGTIRLFLLLVVLFALSPFLVLVFGGAP